MKKISLNYVSNIFHSVKAMTWDKLWAAKAAMEKSTFKKEFRKELLKEKEDYQIMGKYPNAKKLPAKAGRGKKK